MEGKGPCGLARCELGKSCVRLLVRLPGHSPQPALHVASGTSQVTLKFCLGQTEIARSAQAVCPNQLALRSLDGIAPSRFAFESFGPLLRAPRLQMRMVLSDGDRSVALVFAQALLA